MTVGSNILTASCQNIAMDGFKIWCIDGVKQIRERRNTNFAAVGYSEAALDDMIANQNGRPDVLASALRINAVSLHELKRHHCMLKGWRATNTDTRGFTEMMLKEYEQMKSANRMLSSVLFCAKYEEIQDDVDSDDSFDDWNYDAEERQEHWRNIWLGHTAPLALYRWFCHIQDTVYP
jgi:hypothetical protein